MDKSPATEMNFKGKKKNERAGTNRGAEIEEVWAAG